MATKTVQDSSLTAVANAIRAKTGGSGNLTFPAGFISAINDIPAGGGGGASVPPKDVNFYDYDGTVTNAYTASEFAALTAMPANPSHDGLTAQGWNWTLADAQTYVAEYGRLNIGQMYVTTSGDTEIDIQLSIGRNKPYLGCCPDGTVDIDWGDGSAHDTLTGTSIYTLESIQHTYPDTGEMFTIKLHVESGSLGFIGNSSSSTGSQIIYKGTAGSTDGQRAYQNAVKAIRLGSHVTKISSFSFRYCSSLASVAIPENVTSVGTSVFSDCYSLKSVTIPKSVTSIGSDAFNYCYSLASITIPKVNYEFGGFMNCVSLSSVAISSSASSLGTNAFNNCSALTSLTIPKSVSQIENFAITKCSSLKTLIFTSTTPPSARSHAISSLPSDLVVYVPAGTLAAYQAASNYSDISSKMVEMSA